MAANIRAYRKRRRKFILFIILFALLVLIVQIDNQLRPLIRSFAQSRAQMTCTKAINDAIIEELSRKGATYDSMITLEKDNEGKIIALQTNIVEMNRLKAAITNNAAEKITSYDTDDLKIPIGTLVGGDLCTGRGPKVKIKLKLASNATSEIVNNFDSAGINQTRHQVMINFKFRVYVIITGYSSAIEVNSNFCLAETILVGVTPDAFTNIEGVVSDEQVSQHNDYKAELQKK